VTLALIAIAPADAHARLTAAAASTGWPSEPRLSSVLVHAGPLVALAESDPGEPASRDDLARAALRFQACLTCLHSAATILPSRFRSLHADTGSIERALTLRADHLLDALARLDGLEEWRLVHVAATALDTRDAPLAPIATHTHASTTRLPPGTRHLLEIKRRYQAVDAPTQRLRQLMTGDLSPLAALASATRVDGPSTLLPHAGAALLVPRADRATFVDAYSNVRQSLRASLLLSGPWPAMSFVEHDAHTG
jgi:hypothetical protein